MISLSPTGAAFQTNEYWYAPYPAPARPLHDFAEWFGRSLLLLSVGVLAVGCDTSGFRADNSGPPGCVPIRIVLSGLAVGDPDGAFIVTATDEDGTPIDLRFKIGLRLDLSNHTGPALLSSAGDLALRTGSDGVFRWPHDSIREEFLDRALRLTVEHRPSSQPPAEGEIQYCRFSVTEPVER